MAVKHEIKSQLAKLLATEDLIVEHKNCETAQFNVHTRVLTLPMWERASDAVYDMLVGHEVGHALFTPDEDWQKEHKVPHQYVNIVEDIRIEKLMKRKYAGLTKTFFKGYQELSDQDFFGLEHEDVTEFTLADRINLYAKIGHFVEIEFTAEERELLALCESCATFSDVLLAAEELHKYCKDNHQETNQVPMPTSEGKGESDREMTHEEMLDEAQNREKELDQPGNQSESDVSTETQSKSSYQNNPEGGRTNEEPEVKTVDKLAEKIRNLASRGSRENSYVQIPDVNIDRVVVSNSDVHKHADYWFKRFQDQNDQKDDSGFNLYAKIDEQFRNFKKSAQKEVNYLVKEFECKKSADQYAQASTARTGVLDCTKLHTYKYNEDLFRKVTVLPDGKNHGLVFILDWSGSMGTVLLDTIKQLYNLIWFCKKVNIPFDVYAFTNEWNKPQYDPVIGRYTEVDLSPLHEPIEGDLIVDSDFTLLNLFTSSTNGKVLEKQLINIWRVAAYYSNRYVGYDIPTHLCLSGTPLNESLVCLHKILPEFQRKHKVQKIQTVILTDGEAPNLSYYREDTYTHYYNNEEVTELRPRTTYPGETFIRDRSTGNNYLLDYGYTCMTDQLLHQLRDCFTDVNFIGIRVINPRDAGRFIDMNNGNLKLKEIFRKEKSCVITTSGYHAYFAISSTSLAQDAEFDVDEGATKAKIKSAFVKSLKTKKLNKRVLGEFISLVA